MRKLFRLKWIADKEELTAGVAVRLFGIDIALLLFGYVNDWRIIDLRIPCNYGLFCQIGLITLGIGRLADDFIYEPKSY